ncbi:recombinase family protein [Paenibacillus melissococcoides]|uniref:Recombinase family protein n=1 Tax=Paenibacillus melissococcoides TaxID=2912268 RepID=A0ABM9G6T7_9BACL|nr:MULTISPECIES: recombinase family protein [Paenibacillus]MEB9895088.1 recombinase family protein [Bacillus cereus]CAH8247328.1 recombinase family protein [Paenibacillus melissococcoides]CAH8717384.1 recombinase family protein [Paenibacillus melissococcoides]CAH8718371.1 recombinase family protein [Paenibacillus melissococcoides]GIO77872.1 integrase [Paenibacillus dendritiformis]
MRVAAYIRVSTDEQAEKGNSLNEQQERLSAYCKAMGWQTPSFYVDDGYSAKDLRRPEIKRLLTDIERRKFDVVLTSKLDRLSRSLLDLLQTVNMLSEHDCSYVSASESFDTSTAVGRMVLQLLGVFAEFERERISERVKDNMTSLAKNTTKAITRPCYGYDVVDGRYVINEDEAHFVRIMCDLAEEGAGHRMIAKKLNDLGSTTKRGKMWDQVNIKRLLRTETIAGIMVYNKRETKNGKVVMREKSEWITKKENHPGIITPERFARIQTIMQSRKRAHKHADNETYLLTGLVKCKYCGKNMKGSTSRHKRINNEYTYYRYICSSYVLGYGCKHHAVHRDVLEKMILQEMKRVASSSDKELKLKIASSSKIADEIKEIRAQLIKVDKRIQKQIEAYENDLISAEDLKSASIRVEIERRQLNDQLSNLEAKKGDPCEVKNNITKRLNEATAIDRLTAKRAMRDLIHVIELGDEEISITWKA